MMNALAVADSPENLGHLVPPFRMRQHRDRLTDGFLRRITEDSFRAFIPTGDDSIQIFADDRVIGTLNDSRKPHESGLETLSLADVLCDFGCSYDTARSIADRRYGERNRKLMAILVSLFGLEALHGH